MNIEGVTLLHFSPTGRTRQILLQIAAGLGFQDVREIDLSRFETRWQKQVVPAGQLVVFGFPVYSGRLPPVAREVFQHVRGSGNPAVAVVVFGNRAFEDALLELKNNLDKAGFAPIAAAAFIAEHSMNTTVGAGRPDAADIDRMREFGRRIRAKTAEMEGAAAASGAGDAANAGIASTAAAAGITVPGTFPYRAVADTPLAPTLNGPCSNCGACIRDCPIAAIDPVNPARVDAFRCILCLRCVHNCPEKSRGVLHEKFNLFLETLPLIASERKEPTLIV